MNLKSMSIDELVGLRGKIDAALASKVADERRVLEGEIAKLSRYQTSGRSKSVPIRGARGKVEPKYRNPENPSETWAGRGLKPRWLTAAIKAGKKLEDFGIEGTAKESATRGTRKKSRARRK
jgi:DNA-binding protein H-NS